MIFVLERRTTQPRKMSYLSPMLAIILTIIAGAILFSLHGSNPLMGLYVYFIEPLTSMWSLEELLVKAAPLTLIGAGLVVCFTAGVWNIGAEGQLTFGAIFGAAIPVYFNSWQSPITLIAMLLLGFIGGALFGAIPALLKTRFGANEILTSLMLVYVAQMFLDWLVRGPWRDPHGYNFPKTVNFDGWQLLPIMGNGRLHIGILLALVIALGLSVMMGWMSKGFEIKVSGAGQRAAAFAGFSRSKVVWFCFLLSGGLAGLAGICEVAGPSGQLQPVISPGYGFTAIIVAFLARLNPVGAILAALLLALSYLGGEAAQVALGVSTQISQVFQGILLFFILACDTLILYRIKMAKPKPIVKAES